MRQSLSAMSEKMGAGPVQARSRERILLLDILRGLAVLNMVAYHLLYDLVYIFGVRVDWFSISQGFVWEQWICFTFILIAGISFRLSRNPLKNGLRLAGCGLVLTVVTLAVIPEEVIWFGILHLLGGAYLLTWLIRGLLERIPAAVGFVIAVFLFALLRNVPEGWIGGYFTRGLMLPEVLYDNPLLFWAGFPGRNFFSADYFPLIPWLLLFWVGYFGGVWWIRFSRRIRMKGYSEGDGRRERAEEAGGHPGRVLYRGADRSLGAVGRKSLWIYMLHQPLIYGVLLLLQNLDWI